MERLTERFKNGQAAVYGCGNNCKYDFKYCNNYLEDCPTINEIYEKLATYEDLEGQGKLLKLPCAVGDKVYLIKRHSYCPSGTCRSEKSCSECRKSAPYKIVKRKFKITDLEEIGKTIFLTQEEAEAALKEMSE